MLTDHILTQLMVFVHKHLGLVQLMFVELLLSSSRNPVPVDHGNTTTLLTGSVDYAIMSSVDGRAALATALGVRPDDVEESELWPVYSYPILTKFLLEIRDMSSDNSLDAIMGTTIWPLLKSFKHFQFTIIEEKRKSRLKEAERLQTPSDR